MHIIRVLGSSQDDLILLTSPTGGVSSPDKNSDGMYDNNIDMMWIIEATTMKLIRYQILYVEIENSDECSNDALRVCKLLA